MKNLILAATLITSGTTLGAEKPKKLSLCSTCHGTKGVSPKTSKVPHLAGQKQDYLIEQLDSFQKGDRKGKVMHSLAKGLTKKQIKDLAVWFSAQELCKEGE